MVRHMRRTEMWFKLEERHDVSFILILSKNIKQNQDDLDACACVCACTCVCIYTHVCAVVHTCGGQKTILDVVPHFPPCLRKTVLLSLLHTLHQLTQNLLSMACLHFLSFGRDAEITDSFCHFWLHKSSGFPDSHPHTWSASTSPLLEPSCPQVSLLALE